MKTHKWFPCCLKLARDGRSLTSNKTPSYVLHYLSIPNSSMNIGSMTAKQLLGRETRVEPHLPVPLGDCSVPSASAVCWWQGSAPCPFKVTLSSNCHSQQSQPRRCKSIMSQTIPLKGNYIALHLGACDLGQSCRAPHDKVRVTGASFSYQ